MNHFKRAALAAAAALLTACASPQGPAEQVSFAIDAQLAELTTLVALPVVSDFDTMRAALPTFELERENASAPLRNEISVIRDISFEDNSPFVTRLDIGRIEPLKAYLRANPEMAVRIEGYGDGRNSSPRDADLSLSRAEAVGRAILTDIRIANSIVTVGAAMPQAMARTGSVEIIFVNPALPGN